jgi:hypothetical protein
MLQECDKHLNPLEYAERLKTDKFPQFLRIPEPPRHLNYLKLNQAPKLHRLPENHWLLSTNVRSTNSENEKLQLSQAGALKRNFA